MTALCYVMYSIGDSSMSTLPWIVDVRPELAVDINHPGDVLGTDGKVFWNCSVASCPNTSVDRFCVPNHEVQDGCSILSDWRPANCKSSKKRETRMPVILAKERRARVSST